MRMNQEMETGHEMMNGPRLYFQYVLVLTLLLILVHVQGDHPAGSRFNDDCGKHLRIECDGALGLHCLNRKCICRSDRAFDEACGYHYVNYTKMCWKDCVGAAGQRCSPMTGPPDALKIGDGYCVQNSKCGLSEEHRRQGKKAKTCVCNPGYSVVNRKCQPSLSAISTSAGASRNGRITTGLHNLFLQAILIIL